MHLYVIALLVATLLPAAISDRNDGQDHERTFVSKMPGTKRGPTSNTRISNHKNVNDLLGNRDLLTNSQASLFDNFQPPAVTSQTQCMEIPSQFVLCFDIGYKQMHLPNLQGHDSMDELMKQSSEWTPLLATRCHPETRKFLCSVFAPVCVQDFNRPIPPCRSLCESVRDECSPAMARFAYSWPVMLNCSQFPNDDKLCIPPEADKSKTVTLPPVASCPPCRRKKTVSKKQLCSYDFIVKARVKRVSYEKGNTKLSLTKKPRTIFKWLNYVQSKVAARKMSKKAVMWLKDGLNCTCDVLASGSRAYYLFGGWQEKGQLNLDSITKWRKSDKRIAKFLKRKCTAGHAKNRRSRAQ